MVDQPYSGYKLAFTVLRAVSGKLTQGKILCSTAVIAITTKAGGGGGGGGGDKAEEDLTDSQ